MAPEGPLPNSFNRAFTDFQRRLSAHQIEDFQFATLQSLQEAIQNIQHEQAQRQGLRNLAKIRPFIEGLTQYSITIEIFVNIQPLIGAVWGPIIFCLQVASKMNEAFNALLEAYEMIGAALPIVQTVDKLFYTHTCATADEDEIKAWKLTFRLTFNTSREMFGDVLKNLDRSRGLLLQSASVAHFQEAQDARILFTQEFQSRQKRDIQEQMLAVVDWLAAEQSSALQHIELQRRRADFPLTAQWPFSIGATKSWMRRNDVSSSIFWLCGIPGAGKTVLFSSVVDKIKDCFRDAQVAYFYCKCSDDTRRTFDAISRSLIAQLLKQNPTCLEYLYEKMVASGERQPSTPKLCQEILEEICLNHDLLFICLDGLDECELHERNLILSLIGTITKTSKTEQSVRFFITSRKEKDVERSLSLAIRLDIKAQHVESDILSYIQSQASKLGQLFSFSAEKERAVMVEIASRPQGMFLLARLIMDNLLAQENIEDLEDEIDSEVLPSRIEQAYDRILTRLCKNRPEKARQRARFILEIITSATRTLQNHEIQGALSIRVEDQTIDIDRRKSRIPLDELCGPIVEAHLNGVINLIHPTAKNYLLQYHSNYFLNLDRANFTMAKLCVNYLIFPCFDPTMSDLSTQQYASKGEYSFQEYATCNWIHHLELSVSFLTKNENEQEVAAFKSAYGELQKRHVQHSHWCCIQLETKTFDDGQDKLKQNLGALRRLYDVESVFPDGQDNKHPCHLLGHVGRARVAIEICSAELDPENQELFLSAYGAAVYKCPILSCSLFETGFKTKASRDAHYTRHQRNFKCETEDCDYSSIGFSTKAALARHIRLCHDTLTFEPTFPKISRCPMNQALNDAIRKEDLFAVRTLASEIADLPDFGTGFLIQSIIAGSRKAALIIMEILGDTKEMDHYGASGDTALHLLVEAEDEELLSVLLSTAVNINAINQRGDTALHVAIRWGSMPIVRLLLEHPKTHLASYKATTSRVSILHLAVKSGNEEVLRFLLETTGQQLTGANFFFYYGTTIFKSTGISNSYITSIILGTVNVVATIGGLWIVKNADAERA
ncbi:hypothetical protein G7Y89_g11943 [Cudoniella acicularis]|uniref:NACHT domain-containing protein n=1 Tax=Cudoniella acicularis TaxID=354080 RepID=A0A8H4VXE6_9HELO|nr:hypothetical protein G7Y89_g11943 [Cudoniella acicularis]